MIYVFSVILVVLCGFVAGLVQKHNITKYTFLTLSILATAVPLYPIWDASRRADPHAGLVALLLGGLAAFLAVGVPYIVGDEISKRAEPRTVGKKKAH